MQIGLQAVVQPQKSGRAAIMQSFAVARNLFIEVQYISQVAIPPKRVLLERHWRSQDGHSKLDLFVPLTIVWKNVQPEPHTCPRLVPLQNGAVQPYVILQHSDYVEHPGLHISRVHQCLLAPQYDAWRTALYWQYTVGKFATSAICSLSWMPHDQRRIHRG